jgi:hypothetical protein
MPRILNITRGYHMSAQRASRGVAECSFAWVEQGVSVRNLTLAESVAARATQEKVYDPLPYSEIPGIKFSGSTDYALVADAHKFCEAVA